MTDYTLLTPDLHSGSPTVADTLGDHMAHDVRVVVGTGSAVGHKFYCKTCKGYMLVAEDKND